MKRFFPFLLIPLLILPAALILFAHPASAHRPIWESGSPATEIPDISTSYAFYRELDSPTQVDIYTFEAGAGDVLYGGVSIPAIRGLEGNEVMVALLGPGLPQQTSDQLPVELAEGQGARIFPPARSEDFFEPFTQTKYWGRQNIELQLPEDGNYNLVVWHAQGSPGKYVLDIGRREVFGLSDLTSFPVTWLRVHLFFEHGPYLAGLGIVLFIIAGILLLRWRRRKRA